MISTQVLVPWVSSSTCSRKCLNEAIASVSKKLAAVDVDVRLQKQCKKELSRILRTEAAITAVVTKSGSKKHTNLWPKAVLQALDDAIRTYCWDAALKIFGLLRQQHWYEPRRQTFTKLITMLAKCRKPDEAALLFELMLSDGVKPAVDVFTALVNAYALSSLFHQAFATIDDMKSVYLCKPNVHTYSILLSSCVKYRRFDLVNHILSEMSFLGIHCTTVTYNTVLDGYGKAGLFHDMERFLSEMIETGKCHPDVFTLNSLVWAYGNAGQVEKMERWYQEFQVMGISPDVRTFNILIRSYGKARMYTKMESILDYMNKRCFSPTLVTFNTVVDIYGRAGKMKQMDEWFLKMKHQGMKPNSVTYCTLVNAYSKAGMLYRVDSILRQVENSDVVLDTPFFNCLINAYGRSGDVDKMKEILLEMKENKCEPNHITFATMVQAYNAKGMTEDAQDVETKMLAMRSSPSGPKLLEC
ncbi:hypothetical protein RND81_08G230200 [Saponaria officinalis]|uniref:Pentatricopeptide repeat-containing protein n=1 Tax=Saponaria officinalis TaxID=3572 RepID=A0AAW1JAW2_SAPOF